MTAISHINPQNVIDAIEHPVERESRSEGDAFLNIGDLATAHQDAIRRALDAVLAEIESLFGGNRWEDAISLFYPVEDKLPELAESGMDFPVREKLAFALGQVRRFDDAIAQLQICLSKKPDSFHLHNSMAYTAYNSLYAAKNREIFLRGVMRQQRIDLAHTHFAAAQSLRPDGVTNFYRQAMLYRQIEGKGIKALPLFLKAVENWERLTPEEKETRRQERKNYVKALFNGASAALESRRVKDALELVTRCLSEDETTDYVSKTFKYFALGKVNFHLNRFDEAVKALEAAVAFSGREPADFAHELLARTFLCLKDWEKALATIRRIPEKRRRPYICWTEAEALAALGDLDQAVRVLAESARHDGRSRHKTLIRLAKIEYLRGNFEKTMAHAKAALGFFEENWGHPFADGLFWFALGAFRSGKQDDARQAAGTLKVERPDYPRLDKLLEAIG